VNDGVTYAVSLDGHVYAVSDGNASWSFDTGAPIGSVATLSGPLLYVSNSGGDIFALDTLSGAKASSPTAGCTLARCSASSARSANLVLEARARRLGQFVCADSSAKRRARNARSVAFETSSSARS